MLLRNGQICLELASWISERQLADVVIGCLQEGLCCRGEWFSLTSLQLVSGLLVGIPMPSRLELILVSAPLCPKHHQVLTEQC